MSSDQVLGGQQAPADSLEVGLEFVSKHKQLEGGIEAGDPPNMPIFRHRQKILLYRPLRAEDSSRGWLAVCPVIAVLGPRGGGPHHPTATSLCPILFPFSSMGQRF